MSGEKVVNTYGWHDQEVVGAGLPDKRLARRLRCLLDQMSASPRQPVPAACGDWAATKAAYRFFDNPRVTEHGVLAGHFAATAARLAASEGPILILQDMTEFIYRRALIGGSPPSGYGPHDEVVHSPAQGHGPRPKPRPCHDARLPICSGSKSQPQGHPQPGAAKAR